MAKSDYLLPAAIFLLIFYNNLHPFMALDYLMRFKPYIALYPAVIFYLPLQTILYLLHLMQYTFQISIFIAMFISFFYIKKITKHPWLFTIIYFFNPFIYSRIMVGQLGVIISYLLIPMFIYHMKSKSPLKLAMVFTIASVFSIHFFLINAIIYITYLITYKKKLNLKIILFILILNSYWLIPFFIHNPVHHITAKDEFFFAPKLSQDIPTAAKITGMWGFWRESAYITTFRPLWLWYLITSILVILMLTGYYKTRNNFYFTLWWIGLIMAVGISHPLTKPFFNFLFTYLPFFKGLRDSHKFVALMALAYAYFIPYALDVKKLWKYIITIIFIAMLLTYTYPLIGLHHQIKPITYPKSYFEAGHFLENKTGIIYIPWMDYLTYNWTENRTPDGRIANPVNVIFKNVIKNPGPWGKQTSLTINITKCLTNRSFKCLKKNKINYIVYDKCFKLTDKFYGWIKNSTEVYSKGCISIFKNQ